MTFTPDQREILAAARKIKLASNREKRARILASRPKEKRDRGRERDNGHLAFIRRPPCCVCRARGPSEAAHVRMASSAHGKPNAGLQTKPDDRWTVPMCGPRGCHHTQSNMPEAAFWRSAGIDPLDLASDLYAISGDEDEARRILKELRK